MINEKLKQLAEQCESTGEKKWRTVATNLTDLHMGPSFLDELLTQVMNGMRLQVLKEEEKWSFVRQEDGYLGWAYNGFLADAAPTKATHILAAPVAAVYAEGKNPPVPVTRLLGGTSVELLRVEHDCAFIRTSGEMLPLGWVPKIFLRELSTIPTSTEATRKQMIADARNFFGVYYLWGGNSAFGTDCSGLSQLVHRLAGYEIPRDADMQFAAGRLVEEPFQPGDLMFFWNDSRTKISHVGMSSGGWNMIHSSRGRNGVYEEDVQANENLRKSFASARSFLK